MQKLIEEGKLNVENVDVFCEKGVFDVDQTRRILKEGKKKGFRINFHGEELCQLRSAEMGASEFQCEAISHLEEVSDQGIEAMAAAGSVGENFLNWKFLS